MPLNSAFVFFRSANVLKNFSARFLFLLFILFSATLVHADPDTAKINLYLRKAAELRNKNSKLSLQYGFDALSESQKSGYEEGVARSRYQLAKAYFLIDDYTNSQAQIMECIGLAEKSGDTVLISDAYMALSNIYVMQNNPQQAQLYLRKSLVIKKRSGNKEAEADIYNNIGYSFYRVKNFDSAMVYYRQALSLSRNITYKRGVSNTLQNIGHIFNDQKNTDSAEFYYRASLPISIELHDLQLASKNYLKLAGLFFAASKYDSAMADLQRGLPYAREIGLSENLCNYYKQLSLVYEKQNELEKAYAYSKLYYSSLDSFNLSETARKVGEMQFSFEMNRKNHEQELRDAAAQTSLEKRNMMIYASVAGLLLVMVALVYIYRNYRQKTKANLLLAEKNEIIELQKKHVEEKNRDITDSINYAKKIQLALLKEKLPAADQLREHFIFYQPKDIVAGDFYWASALGDEIYIAAADCTGHGVPGALLTMLGVSFLNQIVSESGNISPAEMLDLLRARFIRELSQTGASGESKDGMDISLARFNTSTKELCWSGANNPLWIITRRNEDFFRNEKSKISTISSGEKNLIEIKADKQPIGYYSGITPFTSHQLKLEEGESFYLFTDGFADQFGGPNGKKYKYLPLKEKLLALSGLPSAAQAAELRTEFENWRGDHEQIDDVCIIGVKV